MATHGEQALRQRPTAQVDRGQAVPARRGARRHRRRCRRRSSTRPSTCRSGSASIPSTPTRWCAARSCCRTASARRCASRSSPRARRSARRARPGADVVGAEDLVERIQGGWLDFDTDDRHARPDGPGRPARQGAGPARPDAEPEARHGDVRRRPRGARGKAGKVEFRVDKAGQRPRADRQALVPAGAAASKRARAARGDRAREAGGGQGHVSAIASRCRRRWGPAIKVDAQRIAKLFKKRRVGGRASGADASERSRRSRRSRARLRRRDDASCLTEYRGLTVQQLTELRKQLEAVSARVQGRQEPAGAARRRRVDALGARHRTSRARPGWSLAGGPGRRWPRRCTTFADRPPGLAIKAGCVEGRCRARGAQGAGRPAVEGSAAAPDRRGHPGPARAARRAPRGAPARARVRARGEARRRRSAEAGRRRSRSGSTPSAAPVAEPPRRRGQRHDGGARTWRRTSKRSPRSWTS